MGADKPEGGVSEWLMSSSSVTWRFDGNVGSDRVDNTRHVRRDFFIGGANRWTGSVSNLSYDELK